MIFTCLVSLNLLSLHSNSINMNDKIQPVAGSNMTIKTNTFEETITLLGHLVKSPNTGVSTIGDGLLMLMKAKELGIGFGNAIPHMHVINGRTGVDIHIVKGLLAKPTSGVTWELIKDYEPIYNYTDGVNIFSYTTLPKNHIILPKLNNNPDVDKYRKEGLICVVIVPSSNGDIIPVDYITEYKFTRIKKNIKGEFITVYSTGRFSTYDMKLAKLHLKKDNIISESSPWNKHRKLMIGYRAFKYGATDIANDILNGVTTVDELYEINNIDYELNDDGTFNPITN